MFEVHAFLTEDYKTIYRGTCNYLPRIGEELVVDVCIYKVENIRYIIQNGTRNLTDVHLYLKQSF